MRRSALVPVAASALLALVGTGCGGGATSPDLATACDASAYPCGPFGTGVGDTIDNLSLRVQTGPGGKPAAKLLSDYRAVSANKLIAVFAAAEWCVPCQGEQGYLVTQYNAYASKGVAFIVAVTQKTDMSPSDDSTAAKWATTYSIPFDIATDPNQVLPPYFDPKNYPAAMILRTSDMQIMATHTGVVSANNWLPTNLDAALM